MAVDSNYGKRRSETVEGEELIVQIIGLIHDIDDKRLAQIAEIVLGREVKPLDNGDFRIRDHVEMTLTTKVRK